MPTTIGSRGGEYGYTPSRGLLGGYNNLSWISRNRYDPAIHDDDISSKGVGTIKGGLRQTHVYDLLARPDKYTAITPVLQRGSPIAGGSVGRPRTGNFTLDLINWPNNLSQLTGATIGRDQPLIGDTQWGATGPKTEGQFAPLEWLGERHIGMENAPARLLDYAFAPIAASMRAAGIYTPRGDAGMDVKLPFQESPDYWSWQRQSTPTQRAQQARMIADSRVDRARNEPLYQMLLDQFNRDHDSLTYLSSGNERTDYMAKLRLQDAAASYEMEQQMQTGGYDNLSATERYNLYRHTSAEGFNPAALLGSIPAQFVPFVGTGLGKALHPITPETEAKWAALTVEERKSLLEGMGMATMVGDAALFAGVLPPVTQFAKFAQSAKAVESWTLSTRFVRYAEQLGLSEASIKGTAGLVGKGVSGAVNTSGRTLDAINKLMGIGLVNMTASWGMQAFAPVDSPWAKAGQAMDASRFVSQSSLGGLLNEAGFYAGFYGIGPATQIVAERSGLLAAKTRMFGGLADLAYHRAFGGSDLGRVLRGADTTGHLSQEFQAAALSSEFESSLFNAWHAEMAEARKSIDAGDLYRGGDPGIAAELNAPGMLPEERLRAWEAMMARTQDHVAASISTQLELVNSRALRTKGNAAEKIARRIDDAVTQYVLKRYGALRFPAQVKDLRAEVGRRLSGLGEGQGALDRITAWAGNDPEHWLQAVRRTHQMLFHFRHTELAEVAEQAGEAADDFALFRQTTLFNDEVDKLVEGLADVSTGHALAERLQDPVHGKDQVMEWAEKGAFHTPEGLADLMIQNRGLLPSRRVPAAEGLGNQLDDWQRELDAEGLWTVGRKPVGVFIDEVPEGWLRIADAAAHPEAFGATRDLRTVAELESLGYRYPYAWETRMSGRDFRERNPVWPVAEEGGGVMIEKRPGDNPNGRAASAPDQSAIFNADDETLMTPGRYFVDRPLSSDMRPSYEAGTSVYGMSPEYTVGWTAMGKTSMRFTPGYGTPLPPEWKAQPWHAKPVELEPTVTLADMQDGWNGASLNEVGYGVTEPNPADVKKAGVIVYELAEDGTIGIWAIHPKDTPTGPFAGYDDLTFAKGGVNPSGPSLPPELGAPDGPAAYASPAFQAARKLGINSGTFNTVNSLIRKFGDAETITTEMLGGGTFGFANQREYEQMLDALDDLFDGLRTKVPGTLWRGQRDPELKVGDTFVDPQYAYTALDKDHAVHYVDSKPEGHAVFRMDVPAGTPMIGDGADRILARNLEWRVLSVDTSGPVKTYHVGLANPSEVAGEAARGWQPPVATAPTGRAETLREAAAREMYEELGMTGTLQRYLGDFADETGTKVRYYAVERRQGGPDFMTTPDEVGHVELVSPEVMRDRLLKYGKPGKRDQAAYESFADWWGLNNEIETGGIPKVLHGRNYGADWPVLYDSYSGKEWVFKASKGKPITSLPEAVAWASVNTAKVFSWLGLKVQQEVPFTWQGVHGTIQPLVRDGDEVLKGDLLDLASTPNGRLVIEDLQRQHVADWFTSQHDSNSDSMLIDGAGNLVGIDKGQAWKFFGNTPDEQTAFLSGEGFWRYGAPNTPWYHPTAGDKHLGAYLWDANSAGLVLSRSDVESIVTKIESMPDDVLEGWLSEHALAREAAGWGTADEFISAMKVRRNQIRQAVNAAYEALPRPQFAIARPGEMQEFKAGADGLMDMPGGIEIGHIPGSNYVAPDFVQPPLPDTGPGGGYQALVLVEEEDGRLWAIKNTDGSRGLPLSFTWDDAVREDGAQIVLQDALDETGGALGLSLRGEAYVADVEMGGDLVRVYLARRTGGGPAYSTLSGGNTKIILGTRDQILDEAMGTNFFGKGAIDARWQQLHPPEPAPHEPIAQDVRGGEPPPQRTEGRYVSYQQLPNGEVYRSPWIDYPIRRAADVEMGNRAVLSAKLDNVFRGWRTWRIMEMQKGALYRRLDSLSVAFTPGRVAGFHEGLIDLAREHQFTGIQPVGLAAQWGEIPGMRKLEKEVNALAESFFGKGPYLGRDGTEIVVDWPREIAKAYRTSMKLNLTAGLTSAIKAMGMNAKIAFISDFVYPAFRFALSPLFKAGEWAEAPLLNGMRGVNPFGMDDAARSLWQRSGLAMSGAEYAEAAMADPMLAAAGRSRLAAQAQKHAWLGAAPPPGYAAEMGLRRRTGGLPIEPLTATENLPATGIRERLFPIDTGVGAGPFDDIPTHNVESMIPHTIDADGKPIASAEQMRALDALHVGKYADDQMAQLVGGIPTADPVLQAEHIENLGWAVGYGDSIMTPDEYRRLAVHTPIIHTMGAYTSGHAGLDQMERWMADGIDPLAGPAGRAQSELEAVPLDTGAVSVVAGGRGNTSHYEQLSGAADGVYAGAGIFDNGFMVILDSERMIPRSIASNVDRMSSLDEGAPKFIENHLLGPNGVVDTNLVAIRARLIQHAKDALTGGAYYRAPNDLADVMANGHQFQASYPVEHMFPHGGTWDDIAAIFVEDSSEAQRWADLVRTYGDQIPALRDIEVIVGRNMEEAWRFAFRKAGLADKLTKVFEPSLIAEERLPQIIPDELIDPGTAEVILPRLAETLSNAHLDYNYSDSIENVLAGAVIGLRKEAAQEIGRGIGQPTVQQSHRYAPNKADLVAQDKDRAAARAAEATAKADSLVALSEELAAWRRQTGGITLDRPATPEQRAELQTFLDRAKAAFDGISNDINEYAETPGAYLNIVNMTTAEVLVRRELEPTATRLSRRYYGSRQYEVLRSPEQQAQVAHALNDFIATPENQQRYFGTTFKGAWGPAGAMDVAAQIAPAPFVEELRRLAGGGDYPQVRVWLRGETASMLNPAKAGDVVITVRWGDGPPPISIAEMEDAFKRTAFPETQHAYYGGSSIQPSIDDVWDHEMMAWTPEGGNAGSMLLRNPTRPYGAPRGNIMEDPATGKWAFFYDAANPGDYQPWRIEILTDFDHAGAPAAWNLSEGVRSLKADVKEATTPTDIPGWGERSYYSRDAALPASLEHYRYLHDSRGAVPSQARWAYGWTDRGGYYDVVLGAADYTSRSSTEEMIHDVITTLGDKPVKIGVDRPGQLQAAARMHQSGALPERVVIERRGEGWPDSSGNAGFAQAVTDEELRRLLPTRVEPPVPPDSLEEVAGSVEHLTAEVYKTWRQKIAEAPAAMRGELERGFKEAWNPVPYKQRQQDLLTIKLTSDWFPDVFERSMPNVYNLYASEIGVPRHEMVKYILEDRELMERWITTGRASDFEALVAHADKYKIATGDTRAELDSLYESPDWSGLVETMRWTAKAANDEAFGVHFFNMYRSTFERSINHPLLGVYPASWAYKVAKEWFRFLFQNETLGIRLGMKPAEMIYTWQKAQSEAWAKDNDNSLQDFYDNGPLTSTIFIFNLLMPGDWSNIPFPLSRSLRDLLRGNMDPYSHIRNNLFSMGVGRDVRLVNEVKDEWMTLAGGQTAPRRQGERIIAPEAPR